MQIDETIYLDYQAATPIDNRVLKVMQDAYLTNFANPHAADHILGWKAAATIDAAASHVAELFGLQAEDVIFTSGASEANAMAFQIANAVATETGKKEILIGAADHNSVRNEANSTSLKLRQIPLDKNGAPAPSAVEHLINESTALVSVIGVNNENGSITELSKISNICKSKGVILHADLSQAPLAIDIDLLELDIPFATISAHKLYGPKGVGALLAGPGTSNLVKPIVKGAGQQGGRRGGTMPTELIAGFGEACRLISLYGASERARIRLITEHFVKKLEEKQFAKLVGNQKLRHPGNALMHFPGQDAADLLAQLQPHIAASTQSACSSGSIEPSHVLTAMGLDHETASECIRFSFGRFSNKEQADRAISLLSSHIEANLN